jgi:hypothetical protein
VYDESELLERAHKAYFRAANHPSADQPCAASSDVQEHQDGKVIVTLRNVRGTLMRFRYDQDRDKLIRLVPAGSI